MCRHLHRAGWRVVLVDVHKCALLPLTHQHTKLKDLPANFTLGVESLELDAQAFLGSICPSV